MNFFTNVNPSAMACTIVSLPEHPCRTSVSSVVLTSSSLLIAQPTASLSPKTLTGYMRDLVS